MKTIYLSAFSQFPGGRYTTDGPYSGEAFRERELVPTLGYWDQITVDLDGVMGCSSGFLEEAFGGLCRIHGLQPAEFDRRVHLVCSRPDVLRDILKYVADTKA